MPDLAGRLYIPKLYRVSGKRNALVDVLTDGVTTAGGRVVYSSFVDHRVAPVYLGLEDPQGARYGVLVYPFRANHRSTKNRGVTEHRAQIRLGDPVRGRMETNPIARDVAGVDITLVLTIDPELGVVVGLDPQVYADLPMGISVYYDEDNAAEVQRGGWAVWERDKMSGSRRSRVVEIEAMVGFKPERFLDYVRFEARASSLGLNPSLRARLAREFVSSSTGPHRLEEFFGLTSTDILDIIQANFRLGVAVRGGVAERHLERLLRDDQAIKAVEPIDVDGQPDFRVTTHDGRTLLIECKTASGTRYQDGDFKVEAQKTRDSGAGRQYTFEQFEVLAACLFSATGLWEYRFRWTRDLAPYASDGSRIKPVQRIDDRWSVSMADLLATTPQS